VLRFIVAIQPDMHEQMIYNKEIIFSKKSCIKFRFHSARTELEVRILGPNRRIMQTGRLRVDVHLHRRVLLLLLLVLEDVEDEAGRRGGFEVGEVGDGVVLA